MKKAITILAILIVLVSAVFADPDSPVQPAGKEKITVMTKVDRELPVLRLMGTFDQDAWTTSTTVAQTGYIKENAVAPEAVADVSATDFNVPNSVIDATSIDISHEDLTVYFKVTSTTARCDFVYNIEVTAGPLKSVTPNTEYTIANDVTFDNHAVGSDVEDEDHLSVTVNNADDKFTARAIWDGDTAAIDIGTFDITWEHDIYAPEATYKADVLMTYSVE